jgi:hypothetical protein
VGNIAELRQSTIEKLERLSPHRLTQVHDYIDYLLDRGERVSSAGTVRPAGTLDDLLACVGIWQFEPGELDDILQDIEQSRLMELEEACDGLLA